MATLEEMKSAVRAILQQNRAVVLLGEIVEEALNIDNIKKGLETAIGNLKAEQAGIENSIAGRSKELSEIRAKLDEAKAAASADLERFKSDLQSQRKAFEVQLGLEKAKLVAQVSAIQEAQGKAAADHEAMMQDMKLRESEASDKASAAEAKLAEVRQALKGLL